MVKYNLCQCIIKTNLNIKKFIITCINMDYDKLRFELYDTIREFEYYFNVLDDDDNNNIIFYKDLKKNNFKEYIDFLSGFYVGINKLHEFSKKYNIDNLKCIDFNCGKLSVEETNYINELVDEDEDFECNLFSYKKK